PLFPYTTLFRSILAASHLIEDSAAQSGFEDVKLGFAHCSFETEQQTVVEVCRFVDPILVEDQGVGQRADLQQAVPISAVPRQARNFEPHDNAGVAHAHIRDQSEEHTSELQSLAYLVCR